MVACTTLASTATDERLTASRTFSTLGRLEPIPSVRRFDSCECYKIQRLTLSHALCSSISNFVCPKMPTTTGNSEVHSWTSTTPNIVVIRAFPNVCHVRLNLPVESLSARRALAEGVSFTKYVVTFVTSIGPITEVTDSGLFTEIERGGFTKTRGQMQNNNRRFLKSVSKSPRREFS